MTLYVADIYCGAGGLSAGFQDAMATWPGNNGERFQIAYGVDFDKDAIDTFRALHFPNREPERLEVITPCKDIKYVTPESILEAVQPHKVDVLIGGPNCQGVSAAGLRNPDDARNSMLLAFISLVEKLRPSWFVIENVPGLTHANNRELLARIFELLEAIDGYRVAGDVLLAADLGVPQLRYRLFIVGTNTGAPIRFPAPTHFPSPAGGVQEVSGIMPAYKTVKDAISDLAQYTPQAYDEHALPNGPHRHSTSVPPNHYCSEITKVNRDRIAALLPGQDWRHMPIRLLPERYFATRASDQKGAYGRLLWAWPAYTITNEAYNVTAGPFTHPDQDRPLSVREAARLQSFSDKHVFHGTVISQYRQVGNAVPPRLSQTVAEAILYCHYHGDKAQNWGRPGRITLEVVRKAVGGQASFPTMTPRHVHPDSGFRGRSGSSKGSQTKGPSEPRPSAWDSGTRLDPSAADTSLLRKLAEQPGNYRAAKRAKAIIKFIDGTEKEAIVKAANASEVSVKKWVDGYFQDGLDGWRAYHATPDRVFEDDSALAQSVAAATAKVRQIVLAPSGNGKDPEVRPKRLYMNDYLLELIERFGGRSVARLIEEVEEELGVRLGTVYVGDLLATCKVVLKEDRSADQLTQAKTGETSGLTAL